MANAETLGFTACHPTWLDLANLRELSMRKIIWYLVLFWPAAIIWVFASGVYFYLEEQIASIVSVVLFFMGAGISGVWMNRFKKTNNYKKLAQHLKIDPSDI